MMVDRKILMIGTLIALIGFSTAAPRDVGTEWGEQVNVGSCSMDSSPLIDVEQEVRNGTDLGSEGSWSEVNFTRDIQVWKIDDGQYCAVVEHEGRFQAIEGAQSPGGEGTLTGNEKGQMQGGYRAMISGDLKESSKMTVRGSLDPVESNCTELDSECEQSTWMNQYFESGQNVEYDWWGWIYRTQNCGTWTNSQSSNSGDILCK